MLKILSGVAILANLVHEAKAKLPMFVTLLPSVTLVKLVND